MFPENVNTNEPQLSKQQIHHTKSPFWEVPLYDGEKIKVWDLEVPVDLDWLSDHRNEFMERLKKNQVISGRMRLLAVCPKKPDALVGIKFSIAWCSPHDVNKYTKRKANAIVVGRWIKAFVHEQPTRNTGILDETDTLKNFPSKAIGSMDINEIPEWVDVDAFMNPMLLVDIADDV